METILNNLSNCDLNRVIRVIIHKVVRIKIYNIISYITLKNPQEILICTLLNNAFSQKKYLNYVLRIVIFGKHFRRSIIH